MHNRHAFYRDVARIGSQIARALDYAHEHGAVHRDVKPSNLLIEYDGTPRVTDFGLAQIQDDQGLTLTGELVGTLRYMSPEQFRAARVDQTTDIYSLGLTLYELATGRMAFSAPDRQSLTDQVLNTMPRRSTQIDRRFPRDLETILLKCAAKDRADRYATAAELADHLDRFTRDEPIPARLPRATEQLARWARRNRAVAAWMAVALVWLVTLAIAGPLVAVRHAILASREHAAREGLRRENYLVSIVLAFQAWEQRNRSSPPVCLFLPALI